MVPNASVGAEVLRGLLRRFSQFMHWLLLQNRNILPTGSTVWSPIFASKRLKPWLLGLCLFAWLTTVATDTLAQSHRGANATRLDVRRPGSTRPQAQGQRRRQVTAVSQAPVRTASIEVFDSFDESYESDSYQETLIPAATEYQEIDLTQGHFERHSAGCRGCGAGLGSCICQPFGWLLDWSRSDLWLGTNSFTGASNFLGAAAGDAGQVAGNFGFQEGFNFGTRLPGLLGGQLGSQLGMRFTQTQLDGTTAGDDHRHQAFITAGLFRRVDYGLQGGLVVDYLHDDWVYKADLLQLRGELSFLFSPCHDLGFRFTDSQQIDDTQAVLRGRTTPIDIRLSALNTYRFFYRARFGPGSAVLTELQAGFSEDSSAILGGNLRVPLQNQLGIDLNANYLLPPSDASRAYTQEGWNLSFAMVWTPGRCFGRDRDYYRPLFEVADNGNFLTRHVAP